MSGDIRDLSTDDWQALTKVLAGLILFPANLLAWAFAIERLWAWFVVPVGAPDIGLAHAYGMALLVGIVTWQYTGEHDRSMIERLFLGLFKSAVALAFGGVAHFLMQI